jgi:glycosyltransferase involved in cell wall biosynthesis
MNPFEQSLVSFCMSTYKRPDFLKNQLECILKQTYKNFEIVISDNDTEQSAKQIASAFNDSRIKYFANTENLGMIKSFNKSIEKSIGDYIVMITDDDPIYVDSLQILIDLSIKYPNYGVYAGCGDWIIGNESAANTQKQKIGSHSKLSADIFPNGIEIIRGEQFLYEYISGKLRKAFLLWSCSMVKRGVMLNANCIPDYGSELLGDHAYMLSISSQQGMVYINRSLGGQLVHGANFGYDFYKVENKFINTPTLFFNYVKEHVADKVDWKKNEPLLWSYIGRGWVECYFIL